jgi:hypothetical protein
VVADSPFVWCFWVSVTGQPIARAGGASRAPTTGIALTAPNAQAACGRALVPGAASVRRRGGTCVGAHVARSPGGSNARLAPSQRSARSAPLQARRCSSRTQHNTPHANTARRQKLHLPRIPPATVSATLESPSWTTISNICTGSLLESSQNGTSTGAWGFRSSARGCGSVFTACWRSR